MNERAAPTNKVIIINRINLRGKISLLTMKRSYFGKIPIWELNRLKRFALLAQLAEQRAFNPWVLGSNPRGRTNNWGTVVVKSAGS